MKNLKNFLPMLLWALFILAGSNFHLKLGKLSFSWVSITLPLTFFFFPLARSTLLGGGLWCLLKPFSITLGIPTLFASLSWSATDQPKSIQDKALHLLLPLACILTFCLSPVGSTAKAYSLFWFIPIVLYFLPSNLLSRTLKSTFTAHALGSIIWVYIVPLSGEQWLSLIPLVALERLLITALTLMTALAFQRLFLRLPQQELLA